MKKGKIYNIDLTLDIEINDKRYLTFIRKHPGEDPQIKILNAKGDSVDQFEYLDVENYLYENYRSLLK